MPCERIRRFGIGQSNRDAIAIIGHRSRDQKIATLDHNSTIVESWKRKRPAKDDRQSTYLGPLRVPAESFGWYMSARMPRQRRTPVLRPPECGRDSLKRPATNAQPETLREILTPRTDHSGLLYFVAGICPREIEDRPRLSNIALAAPSAVGDA